MAEASDRQRGLIHAAMGVYIPAVRQYVVDRLDDALGRDWYEAWLKERVDERSLPDHVRDRYVDNLEAVQRGDRDPRDALGPSEFPYVLGDRRDHFPPDLASLIDAMHEVLRDRTIQPDTSDTDAQQQAQRLLENCRAALQPVDEKAARRIQTLLDTGNPDSARDEPGTAPRPRRSSARREKATREAPEQRDGHPRPGTPNNTVSAAGASRPTNHATMPPMEDSKGTLIAIIDIYRGEVSKYICGAFQQRYNDEAWFKTRIIPQAEKNAEKDPNLQRTADRMSKAYMKGTVPQEIIDTGDYPHLIHDHQEVFKDLPINHVQKETMRIQTMRNAYYAHPREIPYTKDVRGLGDDCAAVLRACGKESAASEVDALSLFGVGTPQPDATPSPPETTDDSPPAPEKPSAQDDLELDELRQTDLEAYRWRMGWFLKETPDEWHRHMDRLRNHDVAAWAVELLEGTTDRTARDAETDRIAALDPGPRRKAMAAIWDRDAAAGHRAIQRWAARSALRSPWQDEMSVLFDRDRPAWQALMDEQRQRRNKAAWRAAWRSGMRSLWRRNPEAFREEWAALQRRDEVTYRSEMHALSRRNPEAHAEVESAELAEIGDDAATRRAWFDDDPQRQERHRNDYSSLLKAEEALATKRIEDERAEIAAFGDDLNGLRRWFDADEARQDRHSDEYAALLQWEQERRERAEIVEFGDDLDGLRRWFNAISERREHHPLEYAALLQREREQRERAEIVEFGDDLDGLRRWFNTISERREHHPLEYAVLLQRERTEIIAAFGDDIDGLRRWFDADAERQQRHGTEYATLKKTEQERSELAALGDDTDGLRRWFDADVERQQRHAAEYAALKMAEQIAQEQTELAEIGDNWSDLQRWFTTEEGRPERHALRFAELGAALKAERAKQHREQQERKLREREQAEIAAQGGDLDRLRRWFDTYKIRPKRHPSEYAALLQREQERREAERTEIAALGDDWSRLQSWFAAKDGRPGRHPERFEELQAELALQRELGRERRELAKQGNDWPAKRQWFDADPPRQERHPEAFNELRLAEGEREQFAARAGNLPAQREWFDAVPERQQRHGAEYAALIKAEQIEQERLELAALGDDWPELRRWFAANRGRRERHPAKYAQLRAAEAEEERRRRLLRQEQRDLAGMEHDWDAQRTWFDAEPPRQERHPEKLADLVRAEGERAELANRRDDLGAQRRWFDAVSERRERHPGDYARLEETEAAKRLEDERSELIELKSSTAAQRKWFDDEVARQQRHGAEYAALIKAEQIEQERLELAALGDDWPEMRWWFAANRRRRERHPERFEELQAELALQRELGRERRELAKQGNDWPAKRQWFDADPPRQERHPEAFSELRLAEGEREQFAARAGNLPAQRAWFDAVPERQQRHADDYAALEGAELIEQERLELAALRDDWSRIQHWFAVKDGRSGRHPERFEELQAELTRQRELERERRKLVKWGNNWTAQRNWFNADPLRQERHPEAFDELQRAEKERAELAELEREFSVRCAGLKGLLDQLPGRGDGWLSAQRKWFEENPARRLRHRDLYEPVLRALEVERLIERERQELADLSHEWSQIGRWFAAESGRTERHPKAYAALQRAERDLAQLASLGGDVSARRRWFYRDPRRLVWYPRQRAELKRDAKALREQEREERRREREARALQDEAAGQDSAGEVVQSGSPGGGGAGAARRRFSLLPSLPYVGGGGGSDAATQDGRGAGRGIPPVPEDEAQRGRAPIRRLVWRIVLVLIAAVVVPATAYAVYELIASSNAETEPRGGPGTERGAPAVLAPVIEGLSCSPERPSLRQVVTCSASLGGDAPDAWSWSGGGDPASETASEFSTAFDSPGRARISLAVENSGGKASGTIMLVVGAPIIGRIDCSPASPAVGETVSCTAMMRGGEPTSWLWGGGGEPPTGTGDVFSTTFSLPANRTITLRVENAADSDSGLFAIEVLPPPPVHKDASLSSGAGHSCRLTDDGAAACWGSDKLGRLDVLDGRFTAISAGSAHTCGLRESGAVVCWGWSQKDQLTWPPDRFVSISAGHRHTCGITEQKNIVCWGSDSYGQDADRDGQFSQVSAGYFHNCAITTGGEVECWGTFNQHGQARPRPGRFAAISASFDHTCGLRPGGRVECWGGGEAGESPEGSFAAISAGELHNCGILTSGAVRCWGDDSKGQLAAPAGDDFVQIDAGAKHTCAARSNGEVVCWGDTANGLDEVGSAAVGDHLWQGSDPQPTPPQCNRTSVEGECRPGAGGGDEPGTECNGVTNDDGTCSTDGGQDEATGDLMEMSEEDAPENGGMESVDVVHDDYGLDADGDGMEMGSDDLGYNDYGFDADGDGMQPG